MRIYGERVRSGKEKYTCVRVKIVSCKKVLGMCFGYPKKKGCVPKNGSEGRKMGM